jgi:small-conductance mechanosensitive channel
VRFRITELFAENGIVVAFPQRDVHLDTSSPLELRMLKDEDDAG